MTDDEEVFDGDGYDLFQSLFNDPEFQKEFNTSLK